MDTPVRQLDADIGWQMPHAQTFRRHLTHAAPYKAVAQLRTHAFQNPLLFLASIIVFLPLLAINTIIGLVIAGKTLGKSPSLCGMVLLLLIVTTIPLLLTLESFKTNERRDIS